MTTGTLVPRNLFSLRCVHGTWVTDGKQTSDLRLAVTDSWISVASWHQSFILSQKNLCQMSSAVRWRLASRSRLSLITWQPCVTWRSNRWESLDRLSPDLGLFMALQLGIYKTTFVNVLSHPRDFHLFWTLKMNLAAKGFVADANVKQTLTSEFQTLNTDLFSIPLRKLFCQLCQCLNVNEDNMDCWITNTADWTVF